MKKYCVIGEKLTHTMSPQIHKAYFDYYKKDATYGVKQIAMQDMLDGCKDTLMQYDGFNVTVPYKEKVIKYLSGTSQEAKKIGAVNTVVNSDGKLYGYNTDPYGFEGMLKANDVEIKGKTFVILGSGGASKSVYFILKQRGAKLVKIATRNQGKKDVDDFITYHDLERFKGDVIVNTTPVGMFPNTDGCPVSDEIIKNFDTVVDIVYNPVYTQLLQNAVRLGKKAVGGLYMLVAQAMKSQEIWNNSITDEALTKRIF
ncbi:MAG: shikimate dehydrogenase, partial [Clostridia bacterium]|nr:shikimate dehydrogenase [Clostridia bacterium]